MQTQHNPCAASFRTAFTLWGLIGMVMYTQEHSPTATYWKNIQLGTTALKHSQLEKSSSRLNTHLIFSTVYTSCLYLVRLSNKPRAWAHAASHEDTSKMWLITIMLRPTWEKPCTGGQRWLLCCKNNCCPQFPGFFRSKKEPNKTVFVLPFLCIEY